MNNAEKFEEVYGVKPGYYHCVLGIACKDCKYSNGKGHPYTGCFNKFWSDEYGTDIFAEVDEENKKRKLLGYYP